MQFQRLPFLIIAALVGCHVEPPPEERMPEYLAKWTAKEVPKKESLGNQAKEALGKAEAIELVFLVPDEVFGPPMKEPDKEYFNWWRVISRVPRSEEHTSELQSPC